jgi:hypothetical protein
MNMTATAPDTVPTWKDVKPKAANAASATSAAPLTLVEAARQLARAVEVQASARLALEKADADVSAKQEALAHLTKDAGKIGVEKRAKAKK